MSLYASCRCGIPEGSKEEHLRTDCPLYGVNDCADIVATSDRLARRMGGRFRLLPHAPTPTRTHPMQNEEPDVTASKEHEAREMAERMGFIYWPGGDEPPADWDGGPYLCRDGKTYHLRGYDWRHGTGCWNPTADWDRIGYKARNPKDHPNA